MIRKRLSIFALGLVLVLGANAVRPAKAQALNEWAWAGIGVAAWATIVTVATFFIYRSEVPGAEDQMREADMSKQPVQFGPTRCRPGTDGNLPLACW